MSSFFLLFLVPLFYLFTAAPPSVVFRGSLFQSVTQQVLGQGNRSQCTNALKCSGRESTAAFRGRGPNLHPVPSGSSL